MLDATGNQTHESVKQLNSNSSTPDIARSCLCRCLCSGTAFPAKCEEASCDTFSNVEPRAPIQSILTQSWWRFAECARNWPSASYTRESRLGPNRLYTCCIALLQHLHSACQNEKDTRGTGIHPDLAPIIQLKYVFNSVNRFQNFESIPRICNGTISCCFCHVVSADKLIHIRFLHVSAPFSKIHSV